MNRSNHVALLVILIILLTCSVANSQDFLIRDNDEAVVALSSELSDVINVFEDTNGDGVYDALTVHGDRITGTIKISEAEGFQYEDGRNIAVYPADFMGLPDPGTSALLGFIHYFSNADSEDPISTYIAMVAEQALEEDTTRGMSVYFYDSAGLRVGAPVSIFMEKARLRSIPIYQEWAEAGKDFGIGSNPQNSQFFVYIKDLGLTDHILVVLYQLYQ
ncbi:MAG: hypothetical protein NTY09_10695 [bacterium]|nr:hypothetical protein [bacterium]